MPISSSSADFANDPALSLAKWQGEKYAARASYEKILNERENKILSLSEKSGLRSQSYKEAEKDLDRAEREFERIHSAVRRPLNKWRIAPIYLVIIGGVLALLEAPINKFLFDVALQSSNLGSYAISIMFAAALLIIAHVAGKSLRQVWSDYRKRIVWSSLIAFLLAILVLAFLVCVLTVARASFSANNATIHDLFSNVSTSIGALGLVGTLLASFSDISALVLLTVNFGGIFMTMMLSFFSHDPDKDFDAASTAVEKDRRRLSKLNRSFVAAKEAVIRDFAPDLMGFSSNYKTANSHVIELKRRLAVPLEEDDHFVIDRLDTLAEDAERAEGLGKRDDDAPPVPDISRRPLVQPPKIVAGERS